MQTGKSYNRVSVNNKISNNSISEQLKRIINSKVFVRSRQLCRFLSFVVEASLSGETENIKGYTIATEIFGRDETFDPQQDPIVRIEARRLRRKLEYYYSTAGRRDPVRIEIPTGTYIAVFTQKKTFDTATQQPKTAGTATSQQAGGVLNESKTGQIEPVIAVLPFADFGERQTAIYLLDGFSDELSSGLALFRDIKVIDYYSMAQFRSQPIGIRKIGQQLGADYLISGSIKATDRDLKIRVSLSDAETGVQIWAKVFERSLSAESLSETLSDITNLIISAVASEFGAIYIDKKRRIFDSSHTNLTHYEVMFMHRHAQLTGNWDYGPRIKKNLEQVLASDPEFALGWALMAEIHCDRHAHEYSNSDESISQAYSCSKKAIYYDPYCQQGHYVKTYVHLLRREPEKVIEASKQVFKLNPNAALMIGATALWLCIAGDFDHGMQIMSHSIELNPYYPGWFHHAPFLFHLKQENYEKALAEANKFYMPEYYISYMDKAVATGLLGRSKAANDLLNRIIELHPDFANHPRYYVSSFVMEKELIEKMHEGLKKAGLRAR